MNVDESDYRPGFKSDWHACERAQLIYPRGGVLTLRTHERTWTLSPQQGCWLKPGEPHQVETPSGLRMLSAYCTDDEARSLSAVSGLVDVSDVLRAGLTALAQPSARSCERNARLKAVVVDEMVERNVRFGFPPTHGKWLVAIETALRNDPADPRTLQDWANEAGVSTRTLARAFRHEWGATFRNCRAQIRLEAALAHLAEGVPVTSIAYDLGYPSASKFITHFRAAMGITPG